MRAKAYPGEDAATLPTPADVTAIFIQLAHAACEQTGQVFSA
jgi:hypothetical protein